MWLKAGNSGGGLWRVTAAGRRTGNCGVGIGRLKAAGA